MPGLSGSWKLQGGDNIEALADTFVGLEPARRERLMMMASGKADVREEVVVSDSEIHRMTFVNGEKKRDTRSPFNVDCQVPKLMDPTASVNAHFKKESDNKMTGREWGEKNEATLFAEATGDKLVWSITCRGVTGAFNYTRLA